MVLLASELHLELVFVSTIKARRIQHNEDQDQN